MMDLPEALKILKDFRQSLQCQCHEEYTQQGLHETRCNDYLVDDLDKLRDYIISLQQNETI